MKRFIIPFIIACTIHVSFIWADTDFFKTKANIKPEVQFMKMTLSEIEAPQPQKKPQKKIKKEKSKKKKLIKKILKKQQKPKKNIVKKDEVKKDQKENEKKVEKTKGAVSKIIKATASYNINPKPVYPKSAKKRKWEGIVKLSVIVDKFGKVRSLTIHKSSGYKVLDKSALRQVRNWIFNPGRIGDKPVETTVVVPVIFELSA